MPLSYLSPTILQITSIFLKSTFYLFHRVLNDLGWTFYNMLYQLIIIFLACNKENFLYLPFNKKKVPSHLNIGMANRNVRVAKQLNHGIINQTLAFVLSLRKNYIKINTTLSSYLKLRSEPEYFKMLEISMYTINKEMFRVICIIHNLLGFHFLHFLSHLILLVF